MNTNLRKRMDDLESNMGNMAVDHWAVGIMIGGTGNFTYAENVKTGQLSFDAGFLNELHAASVAQCRAGQFHEIQSIIGGDDPGADAKAARIIQEAIAAGIIDGEQKRSTLRISEDSDDEPESISGTTNAN